MTRLAFLTALVALLLPGLAPAQESPFSPAIKVNGQAVTYFELEQRQRFLEVLRTPGDHVEQARNALVSDRLREQAAERGGITVTEEELREGLTEFAGRANLTPDEFVAALAEEGVAAETYRDFVRSGLLWRKLVQRRFTARINISDADVDRALAQAQGREGVSLLLSELVLPITPELEEENMDLISRLSDEIRGAEAFARAARDYSVSQSALRGGRLDALPIGNLPPQLVDMLLTMRPGEVTPPVQIPNAVAIFLMRGISDAMPAYPRLVSADYLQVRFAPGDEGRAAAAALDGRIDSCDDFYDIAGNFADASWTRVKDQPAAEIPRDIALALAGLDAGESVTAPAPGTEQLRFLKLCDRSVAMPEDGREQMRQRLRNARLSAYADSYLEELRNDAIIVEQ
ncbi:peptidylprolyl isomerase [Rhodovulum sp. YNF3179]|uniref:peptidylprolyl isomerase n=1 Tax=Rhodovulum sp. YNF3179 TaxID=3425127 RepID=UPI003D329CBB